MRRAAITVLALSLSLAALLPGGVTVAMYANEPELEKTETVRVEARRYRFTPSRIKVPAGTRLEIELESRDVQHGFEIEGTGVETVVPAGGRVAVVFEAREPGRYPFRCSVKCGANHASMRGVIVVEEATQHEGEG